MGAHSLGKNRVKNSGYSGDFDTSNNALDNKYYQDMVDTSISWSNEQIKRSSKWQFSGSDIQQFGTQPPRRFGETIKVFTV